MALLEEQAEDLRRPTAELEQFAYVASHDLQEPLRKVASFCQLLERRYAGQLDERADQYIAFAVDGAKRMQRLINDLLAFSRVGRLGRTSSTSTSTRPWTRRSNRPRRRRGDRRRGHRRPAARRGDPTLLTQLFQNLVGNAVKFRREAPPRVTSAYGAMATSGSSPAPTTASASSPEYADQIFVIFQRLHAEDEYGAPASASPWCKKIVEYHGGRIWLDTAPTGTTLRFTLPAVAPAPRTGRRPRAAERTSFG